MGVIGGEQPRASSWAQEVVWALGLVEGGEGSSE